MKKPDQMLFESDLISAPYRAGAEQGRWGVETDVTDEITVWPDVILWMSAAARPDAPERYYFSLNFAGYRSSAPTGTLWDLTKGARLDFNDFPKGKPDSRFARVFRTDWGQSNVALYHPYDRTAANSHKNWPKEMPHLVWDESHSIVDYLDEIQSLLVGDEYIGK